MKNLLLAATILTAIVTAQSIPLPEPRPNFGGFSYNGWPMQYLPFFKGSDNSSVNKVGQMDKTVATDVKNPSDKDKNALDGAKTPVESTGVLGAANEGNWAMDDKIFVKIGSESEADDSVVIVDKVPVAVS